MQVISLEFLTRAHSIARVPQCMGYNTHTNTHTPVLSCEHHGVRCLLSGRCATTPARETSADEFLKGTCKLRDILESQNSEQVLKC